MLKYWWTIVLIIGVLLPPANATFDSSTRFDYTIYLHINSTPSGATLYAVAANEGDEPQEIGITPLTLAIGLDWNRRFWQRAWRTLHITSAQNCIEATYNPDNTYDIFFACDATKSGYFSLEYAESIVTLPHPGFTWSGTKEWPRDTYITLELDKKQTLTRKAPHKIPSMILATGKDSSAVNLGELQVRSQPEDARIYIDGKHIGTTPLNLHIPEGQYSLIIKKRGYADYTRSLEVKSPTKMTIHAIMNQK